MKQVAEGLQILLKYWPDNNDFEVGHDQFWCGGEIGDTVISDEDQKRLDELGFFVDSEFDCYTCFT